jgi:hypothetical protein
MKVQSIFSQGSMYGGEVIGSRDGGLLGEVIGSG